MSHQSINLYHERVRFEDVDAAAIVYHPVYLTYLERARSQTLLEAGYSFKRLLDEGLGIVVGSAEIKFVRPLRLDDAFIVASQVNNFGKSIINVTQTIATQATDLARGDLKAELREIKSLHFYAHLKLVAISQETMRPIALPEWLTKLLRGAERPALSTSYAPLH